MADPIVTRALEQLRARQDDYRRYAEYYRGKQRLAFATDKFRQAFGSVLAAFACNISAVVVDTISDRLQVKGFQASKGAEQDADRAAEIWKLNRMDDRAGRVHREALRTGDAYCIVWRPEGAEAPRIYPQFACRMTVAHDEEDPDRLLWAAKWWALPDGKVRLNVYTPEEITKYVAEKPSGGGIPEKADTFRVFEEDPGEPNPYGEVPIVHFPCDPDIDGQGKSELRNIIPLQDGYNKAICDTLVGMEYVSLPQRYATGLEVDIDPDTGKPKPTFIPAVDRVWTVASPDVGFGQFPAADLTQLLAVQQDWEQKIARQAGIPPHYIFLHNSAPSGEALKALDVPIVKKCQDRQGTFGSAWETVLRLALLMDGRPQARVTCKWEDPAPASLRERAEIAGLHRNAGLPKRYVFAADVGLEGEELESVLAEAQAEQDLAQPALGNPFGGGV